MRLPGRRPGASRGAGRRTARATARSRVGASRCRRERRPHPSRGRTRRRRTRVPARGNAGRRQEARHGGARLRDRGGRTQGRAPAARRRRQLRRDRQERQTVSTPSAKQASAVRIEEWTDLRAQRLSQDRVRTSSHLEPVAHCQAVPDQALSHPHRRSPTRLGAGPFGEFLRHRNTFDDSDAGGVSASDLASAVASSQDAKPTTAPVGSSSALAIEGSGIDLGVTHRGDSGGGTVARRGRRRSDLRQRRLTLAAHPRRSRPRAHPRRGRTSRQVEPMRLPRPLHPGAWWLWALGLATAASRTTQPLLLGLVIAVTAYVVAHAVRTHHGRGRIGPPCCWAVSSS